MTMYDDAQKHDNYTVGTSSLLPNLPFSHNAADREWSVMLLSAKTTSDRGKLSL
jgi:hypothetical protein